MQVLISDATYSYLTPGGKQVHAANLLNALNRLGIDARYETWHDPNLRPDVVHFLGYTDTRRVQMLHSLGVKLVLTQIMDWAASRTRWELARIKFKHQACSKLPKRFEQLWPWRTLNCFDAITYMHEADREAALNVFGLPRKKTVIIPHGVGMRGEKLNITTTEPPANVPRRYLISVGSICRRKNSVFLATVARAARVPIVFVGHAPGTDPSYEADFRSLVDSNYVHYYQAVSEEDKTKLMQHAQAFVLLSRGESGCIAVYEAASSGLPLLLADLPWAHYYEEPRNVQYCSHSSFRDAVLALAKFFETAARVPYQTFRVRNWDELAEMYADVYGTILKEGSRIDTSRHVLARNNH